MTTSTVATVATITYYHKLVERKTTPDINCVEYVPYDPVPRNQGETRTRLIKTYLVRVCTEHKIRVPAPGSAIETL